MLTSTGTGTYLAPTALLTKQHILLFRRPKNYDQMHPPLVGSQAAARLANMAK